MKGPGEILRDFLAGSVSAWEVVGWAMACRGAVTPGDDVRLRELSELEPAARGDFRDRIIACLIELIPNADATTPYEIELGGLCERLLRCEVTPLAFCHQVGVWEAEIVDRGLRYPAGLSGLWNACDWCGEDWTLENSPHLREAATAVVRSVPVLF